MPLTRGQEERRRGPSWEGGGALHSPAGGTWASLFSETTSLPGSVRGCLSDRAGLEDSCSAEAPMARMGAGRKPPSSFPGILLAFPEGPLGATFSGGEVTETGRTSAHPSPPDAHWVKPGQQAWRRRRGAFPCRVFPCHLSSRAHWAHPRNCRGLQSIRFPHASLCSNNLETEAPPKQIRVLNTAGMDLLFLTHAVRPPQNKVGAPPPRSGAGTDPTEGARARRGPLVSPWLR